MSLSGTQPALMYALSGLMRSGASRSGYISPTLYIDIGGEGTGPNQPKGVLVDSLTISDRLNETPNTLAATIRGTKPAEGAEVKVAIGSRNGPRLFAGNILRTTQVYAAKNPANVLWHVEATDYTWQLHAQLISWRYQNLSASVIATDIITRWAPGFLAAVAPGLPVLDEITFTNATVMDALLQVANRIAGLVFCDYQRTIHVAAGDAQIGAPPAALAATHPSLSDLSYIRDLTQVVTRAIVEGGGANAMTPVLPGATAIAVEDGVWYSATGGLVASGPQRIQYGAVSTIANPPTAPTVALAGIGKLVGTFRWKIAFASPLGETIPGPPSTALVCPAFAVPSSPLVPSLAGVGPLVGDKWWVCTAVTAAGETTPGPASGLTCPAQAPAGAPPVTLAPGAGFLVAGGLVGAYRYQVGIVTAIGETLSATSGSVTASRIVPTVPTFLGGSGSGAGTYQYGATYLTDRGAETGVGPLLSIPNAATHAYNLQGASSVVGLTRWRLYRTPLNGVTVKFLAEAAINGTILDNNFPDVELGQAPPGTGEIGTAMSVTVAAGPAGTLARRVYRTKAGGTVFFRVAEIPGNTPTDYVDGTPDDALTVSPPFQNLNGAQVTLTVPTGPAGTLARRIYRGTSAAGPFRRVAELGDNTTTTFTDNVPDASLGSNAPVAHTAGGAAALLDSIPLGGAGITQRIVYRGAGSSEDFKYVGTITDNTTPTFLDTGGDAPGRVAPVVSTVGAALTGIPASGAGQVHFPIAAGDPVNLVVVVDDVPAQAALAATVGGTGIREGLIKDGRIGRTEAAARGTALLKAQSTVLETLAHRSRDIYTRSGSLITVNLGPPTNIAGTFRIQDVGISTFNPRVKQPPTFEARSSTSRTTFEDLLRVLANTDPPPSTGETTT